MICIQQVGQLQTLRPCPNLWGSLSSRCCFYLSMQNAPPLLKLSSILRPCAYGTVATYNAWYKTTGFQGVKNLQSPSPATGFIASVNSNVETGLRECKEYIQNFMNFMACLTKNIQKPWSQEGWYTYLRIENLQTSKSTWLYQPCLVEPSWLASFEEELRPTPTGLPLLTLGVLHCSIIVWS